MKTQAQYSDEELIQKILHQETALFELIIRRNNQSLYRIGKMYHFSHEDTQDLMQETYIKAYTHLNQFQNRSSLKTWLSKIMVHECYRKSQKWAFKNVESLEKNPSLFAKLGSTETSNKVMNTELNTVIEKSLLHIPEDYRTVFLLREINGLNVLETAEILDITESNVKTRLSRAKSFLRKEIEKTYNKEEIFEFNLIYCDAMVERVMQKIVSQ
ncbi:sigma-70 family RNA polymerase sigma factor [Kaistella yonginensis]|uniref:sigma-70 family RNA polymerase sigma factor n=1 Tax=Kaistella yonginensis TaxID=658267 RepID=UPI0025B2B7E9|nr:sigma-70 family RNA polymerase sigma factor [Kaistella yonginensis]MDN3606555.1 sigma-70 family RNA polymerase sigma factor [Kaistella yonginensis]